MKEPAYRLYRNQEKKGQQRKKEYLKSELEDMTTVQLKQICMQERIIQGMINPLDRYEMIELIMRYRGVEKARLISKIEHGGMERISKILERKLGMEKKEENGIQIPARMVFYQELALIALDRYSVRISEKLQKRIGEGNVLMVGEQMELATILHLEKEKDEFFLTYSEEIPFIIPAQKVCYLIFFEQKESDYLFQAFYDLDRIDWAVLDYYKVPLLELELRRVEETEAVLSIDFGTSNTAAGAYLDYRYIQVHDDHKIQNKQLALDEINIVKFQEKNGYKSEWRMLLPSMVSIEAILNTEEIEYHFGYEAQKELRNRFQEEICSVFYEMKRWVESYEEEQELVDKKGNTVRIKRAEVIRKFFIYVIQCAEQQFKCRFRRLQIILPIKQQLQYKKMLQVILPEYQLEEICLDEGTAVVFHTIYGLIEKQNYFPREKMQAIVLDCGGGTTDLSSCFFTVDKDAISYQIQMDTTYENGDTGFGGNGLTYRVMQYIKILLVAYYTKEKITLQQLFPAAEEEVYSYLDQYGRESFYAEFEKTYQKAEKWIPTQFLAYENRSRKEYAMVKNNFYFLFRIAEKLKMQFFQMADIRRSCFGEEGNLIKEEISVTQVGYWSLILREKERWVYYHDFPNLILEQQDIRYLLKGDIYEIINRFFGKEDWENRISKVDVIRLTGQSCRIGLFRDALKEFVPGKQIRFHGMTKNGENQEELKLTCIRGAIRYTQAKKTGMYDIQVRFHLPQIPYSVSAFTYEKEEKTLIYRLDQRRRGGNLSRHRKIQRLDLYLKDEQGKIRYRYVYENQLSSYKKILYQELQERYQEYQEYLLQEDTDTIQDTEVKFFVFASFKQWGFYLIPVMREGTQLYVGKEAFYEFEREQWGLDFFDGRK